MSSVYEDELNRLIKKKMFQLRLLSRQNVALKDIKLLKADIKIMKSELKHFQKAMEHFRIKTIQPVKNQAPSS